MNQVRMLIYIGLTCLCAPAVFAQEMVESFGAWRVFTTQQQGKKTCYIASLPTKKEGNYSKRGEPYMLVTDRGGNVDEISISSGYRFREKSELELFFGQRKYALFTQNELAWAYDQQSDKDIVRAMMRGREMVARGQSWKNTQSKDTYSLKGFTDAHRKMKQLCK